MSNEAVVVDDVKQNLMSRHCYGKKFTISREKPNGAELLALLKTSSKRGTNQPGKCDIILEPKSKMIKNVFILIECKADEKKHGMFTENSDSAIKDKALPGVVHYLKKVWSAGDCNFGHNLVGCAVSGMGKKRKITIVGVCAAQNCGVEEAEVKLLFDEIKEIPDYKEIMARLFAFDNFSVINTMKQGPTNVVASIPFDLLGNFVVSNQVQRHFSMAHKKEMIEAMMQRKTAKKSVVFPGTLILISFDSTYYIVDGQHRFEAYKDYQLFHGGTNETVLVQIIQAKNMGEVEDMYTTHYKAMIPTTYETKKKSVTQKLRVEISEEETEEEVTEEESEEEEQECEETSNPWSYKLSCKVFDLLAKEWTIVNDSTWPPNITRNVQMELFSASLFENQKKYANHTAEAIMDLLRKKNKKLAKSPPTGQKSNPKKPYGDLVYKRAKDAGCYLGLVWAREWLE